jgi:hypothetical protein
MNLVHQTHPRRYPTNYVHSTEQLEHFGLPSLKLAPHRAENFSNDPRVTCFCGGNAALGILVQILDDPGQAMQSKSRRVDGVV